MMDATPKADSIYSHAGHRSPMIKPETAREAVGKAIKSLNKQKFDTIAWCGLSGALLAPILAYKMKKEILVVRKKEDMAHSQSCHRIEGHESLKRYVIVDDLISSGRTILAIIGIIKENCTDAECIGVYTYHAPQGFKSLSSINQLKNIDFLKYDKTF